MVAGEGLPPPRQRHVPVVSAWKVAAHIAVTKYACGGFTAVVVAGSPDIAGSDRQRQTEDWGPRDRRQHGAGRLTTTSPRLVWRFLFL